MNASITTLAPDLRTRAPRSLRCRLGGYAVLPRLLDKCRAHLAGTPGDYHYNCPLDQQFLAFTGIDADKLKQQIASSEGDAEILTWIHANAPISRTPWEIEQWSTYQDRRAPELNTDLFTYFQQVLTSHNPARGDVRSWADLLDLDDHCSFGGIA